MKYSEIKGIRDLIGDCWRDVIRHMKEEVPDFEVDDYRFIHAGSIDKIMQDELKSGEYTIGCLPDWFLADVTGLDLELIVCMQKGECFTALGKLVLSLGKLEELQEAYKQTYGYEHHFGLYDGDIAAEINDYYVFRVS